jgi:hypothetical protein
MFPAQAPSVAVDPDRPSPCVLNGEREALDTVLSKHQDAHQQYGVSLHNPACPSWDVSNSPPAQDPKTAVSVADQRSQSSASRLVAGSHDGACG